MAWLHYEQLVHTLTWCKQASEITMSALYKKDHKKKLQKKPLQLQDTLFKYQSTDQKIFTSPSLNFSPYTCTASLPHHIQLYWVWRQQFPYPDLHVRLWRLRRKIRLHEEWGQTEEIYFLKAQQLWLLDQWWRNSEAALASSTFIAFEIWLNFQLVSLSVDSPQQQLNCMPLAKREIKLL